MHVSYMECDLAECPERVGPLDANGEHANLAGWIKIGIGVFKLAPEEIESEKQQLATPFGLFDMGERRNQLESDPLHGSFCSWDHAVRWVQAEALIWEAAAAGR